MVCLPIWLLDIYLKEEIGSTLLVGAKISPSWLIFQMVAPYGSFFAAKI
jgi:hypothetical protein